MNQAELLKMIGDLNRRVTTAERRSTTPTPILRPSGTPTTSTTSLIKLRVLAKTGWTTPNVWEDGVWETELALGSGLAGESAGVRVSQPGVYRVLLTLYVQSTSPGSDALLGVRLNGAAIGPRVKLDPEDLIHGATGTYYDGASLATLLGCQAGDLLTPSLNVQGNPGLSTLDGQGSFCVERIGP